MNELGIEQAINDLKRTSSVSLFMILIGAACLVGSLYYSATRLTPLEGEVARLSSEAEELEIALHEKENLVQIAQMRLEETQMSLASKEQKLDSVRSDLDTLISSLVLLQEGVGYLLNRQYAEAINSFEKFLVHFPDSHEALNFLGYAELRYAQFWRENSKRKGITKAQKIEYLANMNNFADSAETHLLRAYSLNSQYAWSGYNLALLYYQDGEKEKALDQTDKLLTQSPHMLDWLCEDGQFRKMRTDQVSMARFVEIVGRVMKTQNRSACWVIKEPVKN